MKAHNFLAGGKYHEEVDNNFVSWSERWWPFGEKEEKKSSWW